jgi:lysophospholipase L1-like esterase
MLRVVVCFAALALAPLAWALTPGQLIYLFGGSPLFKPFSVFALPHFNAALAATKAGTSDTFVLELGDSTTRGAICDEGANVDNEACAWPTFFSQYASYYGLSGAASSICGEGAEGVSNIPLYDPRVTISGALTSNAGASTSVFGGQAYEATAAAGMTFTPVENVDTFTVYYLQSSTTIPAGSFTENIDGGSNTTVNTSGANALGSSVLTAGSAGSHTLHLAWVSGTIEIACIVGSNSHARQVISLNGGIYGSSTANWDFFTYPWSRLQASSMYSANLVIIDLGINDMLQSVGPATYFADMQAIITQARASGTADVVLKTFIPQQSSSVTLPTQTLFLQRIAALAKANNLQVINTNGLFGSWVAANAKGWMSGSNHALAAGNSAVAQYAASLLFSQYPYTPPTYAGPIDAVAGATACWSLRSCSNAYSTSFGRAIQIRRASDSNEVDIYLKSTGGLDTGRINTFCASTTCYASEWYDQTGNANHLIDATAADQPQLSLTGLNSKATLSFGGSPYYLLGSYGGPTAQPYTLSYIAERTGTFTSLNNTMSASGGGVQVGFSNAANSAMMYAGTLVSETATDSAAHAIENVFNGASSAMTVDETLYSSLNPGSSALSGTIGTTSTALYLTGAISEELLYGSLAMSTANQTALQTNQKAYWGTP